MRIKGYTVTMIMGRDTTRYEVALWEQPLHNWLIAKLYHYYTELVFSFPGFKRLEKWLQIRGEAKETEDNLDYFYIPISNRQDLRCEHLSHKNRKVNAILPLDTEQGEELWHRSVKDADA